MAKNSFVAEVTFKLWKLWEKKLFVNNGTIFLRNLKLYNGMASSQKIEQKRLFKLASVKSVSTACVCIVFFFHYFKNYGQNIFSRIKMSYLIAKVERKE